MFINSFKRAASHHNVVLLSQQNMRFFGVLPKLPKLELTMRTPYETFFKNFKDFSRVYVGTSKG